ncbi:hypothetical protein DL771_001592 [Monosporascus sp. 5C6A]|nr:hypothetical protein DL771_001592 [Monosporascus sp. 5C6A]
MGGKVSKSAVAPQAGFPPCVIDVEIKPCSTRAGKTADGGGKPGLDSDIDSITILLSFSHINCAEKYDNYLKNSASNCESGFTFEYNGKKDIEIVIDSTVPFYPTNCSESVLTFATDENANKWEKLAGLWTGDPALASNERRISKTLNYYAFCDLLSVSQSDRFRNATLFANLKVSLK